MDNTAPVTHSELVETLTEGIAKHYQALRPSDSDTLADIQKFQNSCVNLGISPTEYLRIVVAALKRAGNRPLAQQVYAMYLDIVRAED